MARENEKRSLELPDEDDRPLPLGKSWFFGIGINDYEHFSTLNNAVRDVEAVLSLLRDRYEIDEAELLINAKATRRNILRKLEALAKQVKPEDKLLIYFSGHGHLSPGGLGFWVPVEADAGYSDDYIPNSRLRDFLMEIRSRHTLLISDACFSGALFAKGPTRQLPVAEEVLERKISRYGFCSGRSNEAVYDGPLGGHSPFASSILETLRENTASRLRVSLLAETVMSRTASQYRQLPHHGPLFDVGDQGGQYIFRLKADEVGDWQACQQAGTVAAYQAFLAKYPNGKHASAAQSTLSKLEEAAAWTSARTIADYNTYLDRFPGGPHADEAFHRIKELEDDAKWAEAQRIDQVYAYRDYLRRFPNGNHEEEARRSIQKLETPVYEKVDSVPVSEKPKKEKPQPIEKRLKKTTTTSFPFLSRRNLLIGGGLAAILLLRIWGIGQMNKESKVTTNEESIPTIRLNGLTWMSKNLDVEVPDSWCYDNKSANCNQYGRLYTWSAAKQACASLGTGWRLPTDQEWRDMAKQFGGAAEDASDRGAAAYNALKEGGKSGFSALLGGSRAHYTSDNYSGLREFGFYWSDTENVGNKSGFFRFTNQRGGIMNRDNSLKGSGFSCRCVQD